jgi:hypothetical protein
MKRISLLACAIAGIVALAQAQAQAQGSSQPAPVEGTNCDKCRTIKAQCDAQNDTPSKQICMRNYMQCRCP